MYGGWKICTKQLWIESKAMNHQRKPKPAWFACLLLGGYASFAGGIYWACYGREFGQGVFAFGVFALALSTVLFATDKRK
jgi:hypothetical protein